MNADKLRSLVAALRARTVANGCTEAEAVAAAGKLVELLDRYHADFPQALIETSACQRLELATHKKQRQPIGLCLPAIAALFDCRVWMERDASRKITHVVLGLPESLEMVATLEQVIRQALAEGWEQFRASQRFIRQGDDAKASFQFGMAASLAERILAVVAEREQAAPALADGRALVVVRRSLVDQAFGDLGLTLRESDGSGRRFDGALFTQGQQAADEVGLALPGQEALFEERSQPRKKGKRKTPGF